MKYKVGDRVKVINDSMYQEYNGHIGKIKKIASYCNLKYLIEFNKPITKVNGNIAIQDDFDAEEIELYTENNVLLEQMLNK